MKHPDESTIKFSYFDINIFIHKFALFLNSKGTNYFLAGPVYSDTGLINLLLALYSIKWPPHPVILEITKIAVNMGVGTLLLNIQYTHIIYKHWHCKNQDLDKSFSPLSFFFLYVMILAKE
jgi:hypothetical protein